MVFRSIQAREYKLFLLSGVVTRLVSEVEAHRPEERVEEIFGPKHENMVLLIIIKMGVLNIYFVVAMVLDFLRQNMAHANLLANPKVSPCTLHLAPCSLLYVRVSLLPI